MSHTLTAISAADPNLHPRVYCEVINLARASDRREIMVQELDRSGICGHFFAAEDFAEVGEAYLLAECLREGPWGPFHIGNQAATLSHARAWERFLKSGRDYALIFEDDVFVSADFGQWIADPSWWPPEAQVVKFESWRENRLKVLLATESRLHRGRDIRRLLSRHMGAASYMLTRAAAERLLAARPFDMVVDHILFNINASRVARSLPLYQVVPAMAVQGNEPPARKVYMPSRPIPRGFKLLKQKLKRAYYEVAYPMSTYRKLLSGSARLERIPFALDVAPLTGGSPTLQQGTP